MHRTFPTLATVAAIALGVAACGGSTSHDVAPVKRAPVTHQQHRAPKTDLAACKRMYGEFSDLQTQLSQLSDSPSSAELDAISSATQRLEAHTSALMDEATSASDRARLRTLEKVLGDIDSAITAVGLDDVAGAERAVEQEHSDSAILQGGSVLAICGGGSVTATA